MDNNTMMEQANTKTPKKKNPIGLILLIIILMIGCLIGGYLINEYGLLDNYLKKKEVAEEKETKKETTESETKKYDVDDPKVAKLIDNIIYSGGLDLCKEIEFLANDKKVEVKDIDSARAWAIAMHDSDLKGETILLEDVNKTIAKYLGKDYKFNPKLMKNICGTNYEYDEEKQSFISKPVTGGCGGSCGAMSTYKLTKAVDTDGVLKLEAQVIFGVDSNYASDYNKNIIIGTHNDNIDTLFEKGSKYQFTFKEEDGNYIFVSAEPME